MQYGFFPPWDHNFSNFKSFLSNSWALAISNRPMINISNYIIPYNIYSNYSVHIRVSVKTKFLFDPPPIPHPKKTKKIAVYNMNDQVGRNH